MNFFSFTLCLLLCTISIDLFSADNLYLDNDTLDFGNVENRISASIVKNVNIINKAGNTLYIRNIELKGEHPSLFYLKHFPKFKVEKDSTEVIEFAFPARVSSINDSLKEAFAYFYYTDSTSNNLIRIDTLLLKGKIVRPYQSELYRYSFYIPKLEANIGEKVTVPVHIGEFTPSDSAGRFRYKITFNKTLLALTDTNINRSYDKNKITIERTLLLQKKEYKKDEIIDSLEFIAALGNAVATPIELHDVRLGSLSRDILFNLTWVSDTFKIRDIFYDEDSIPRLVEISTDKFKFDIQANIIENEISAASSYLGKSEIGIFTFMGSEIPTPPSLSLPFNETYKKQIFQIKKEDFPTKGLYIISVFNSTETISYLVIVR